MFVQGPSLSLPETLQDHLADLGVTVVPNGQLPVNLLGPFIVQPSAKAMLDMLIGFQPDTVSRWLVNLRTHDGESFLWIQEQMEEVSKASLTASQKQLLRKLPLFKTAAGTRGRHGHVTSVEETNHLSVCQKNGFHKLIKEIGSSRPLISSGSLANLTTKLDIREQEFGEAMAFMVSELRISSPCSDNLEMVARFMISYWPDMLATGVKCSDAIGVECIALVLTELVQGLSEGNDKVSQDYYNGCSMLIDCLSGSDSNINGPAIWRCSSGKFHSSESLAASLPDGFSGFCPFICQAHPRLLKIPHLVERLKLKTDIAAETSICLLQQITLAKDGNSLSLSEVNSYISLTKLLQSSVAKLDPSLYQISLPDTSAILYPAREMIYCSGRSGKSPSSNRSSDQVRVCHSDVTYSLALYCGADVSANEDLEATVDDTFEEDAADEEDFGQQVELIPRIASIVKEYSGMFDVIYEFIQNADDAGATQVVFVYDERQHGTEALIRPSWAELQGPALIIYNNSTFSEPDFRGICRVGIGSKQSEAGKIGRYGSGFNVCYRYTDCPSFISDNESLCVFDPLRRYMPKLHKRPGRRWRQISASAARGEMRDVYGAFHVDDLPLPGATMFRLPFRLETSDISNCCMTKVDFMEVINSFKQHALGLEMILFLKSVTDISFRVVDSTGCGANIWSVAATKTHVDGMNHHLFNKLIKSCCSNKVPLAEIQQCHTTYRVEDRANKGTADTTAHSWLVTECFGLRRIPKKLQDCQSRMNNFPLAGVACKLNRAAEINGKTFCALPLKERTGLPVHINGMFELACQGRDGIFADEQNKDERHHWNQALISDVLVSAYVNLLEGYIKDTGFNLSGKDAPGSLLLSEKLEHFYGLFPRRATADGRWKHFRTQFYRTLVEKNINVFAGYKGGKSGGKLFWSAPVSSAPNSCPTLFVSHSSFPEESDKRSSLISVLVNVGINILPLAEQLYEEFQPEWETEVENVNPKRIAQFLQAKSADIVPTSSLLLSESPFREVENVGLLFHYIYRDNNVKELVTEGVPLLVTADQKLRNLSSRHAAYCVFHFKNSGRLQDVFPHHLHQIVAPELMDAIPQVLQTTNPVFRVLDITGLAQLLSESIPLSLRQATPVVVTDSTMFGMPSKDEDWLAEIWNLMGSMSGNESGLKDMSSFCLLPVTQATAKGSTRKLMYPIQRVGDVLSSSENPPTWLFDASLPVLPDWCILPDILRGKLCTLATPKTLILALLAQHKVSPLQMTISDARQILMVVANMNPKSLQDVLESLKALPIFETFHGDLISIGKQTVHSIEHLHGIPMTDNAVWLQRSKMVLLRGNSMLAPVFKMLGIKLFEPVDLYYNVIIPWFPQLSIPAQVEHLKYMATSFFYRNKEQWKKIQERLKTIKFIKSQSGDCQKVDDFYDSSVSLFQVFGGDQSLMCLPNIFVSELRKADCGSGDRSSGESGLTEFWIGVFRGLGLKFCPEPNVILQYAADLANVKMLSSKEDIATFRKKSEALINAACLNLTDKSFRSQIVKIKFLLAGDPGSQRCKIAKPHLIPGTSSGNRVSLCEAYRMAHVDQIWTVAPMLPDYAEKSLNQCGTDKTAKNLPGISPQPQSKLVLQHVAKLFRNPSVGPRSSSFLAICTHIYKYLQGNMPNNPETLRMLSALSLVYIPSPGCCLRPDMVYLHGLSSFEVYGVVHQMPKDFAGFGGLFEKLGAPKEAKMEQYLKALKAIKYSMMERADGSFNAGEKSTVERIQYCLLIYEPSPKDWQQIDELYLLASNGDLVSSSQLIYSDSALGDLETFAKTRLLWRDPTMSNSAVTGYASCAELTAGCQKFIESMPEALRPRLLSSLIVKCVSESGSKKCISPPSACRLRNSIQATLQSLEFISAFDMLFAKYGELSEAKTCAERIQSFSKGVRVVCYERLQTHECCEGTVLVNSSKMVDCTASSAEQGVIIHVQHSPRSSALFNTVLAMEISSFLPPMQKDGLLILQHIIVCDSVSAIDDILASLGVKAKRQSDTIVSEFLELALGDDIPQCFHSQLNQGLDDQMTPGTQVAIWVSELEDGSDSYIYGEIASSGDETHAEGIPVKQRSYRVRFAAEMEEVREVPAVDVYGFIDERNSGQWDYDKFSERSLAEEMAAACGGFCQPYGIKAAKRIYRKTLQRVARYGGQELAKNARGVLSQQLARLESDVNGRECDEDHDDDDASLLERYTYWNRRIDLWDAASVTIARAGGQRLTTAPEGHRGDRRRVNVQMSEEHHSGTSGDAVRPNHDNAKRWMIQALQDILAALVTPNEAGESIGFEHVVLLCHQALENALNAVLMLGYGEREVTHDLKELSCMASR